MKKRSGLLIGIICALALGMLYLFGSFKMLEYQGLDFLFKTRGSRPINPNIVIVEIDDDALANFGRWPWTRDIHAEFLGYLQKFHPKAIVFDILFSEPEEEHPERDAVFAECTKNLGNVFFASSFDLKSEKIAIDGDLTVRSNTMPIKQLAEAARGCGFINLAVEPDGKIRRTPIFLKYEGKEYPSLDLLTVSYYLGISPHELRLKTDRKGLMWINYAGDFERFRRISFTALSKSAIQIEDGEKPLVDLNFLRDKIIIIGLTAAATEDHWPTSVSSVYPGVGIRASIMNAMLQKDFINRINPFIICLALLILGSSFGLIVPKRNPSEGIIFFVATILGITITAILLFRFFNVWMDYATMLAACCVIYPVITMNQFIITRFEKGLIEKELQIASRIQQSILPQGLPQAAGIELGVKCVPAKHVGGDFYDFIKLMYDFVKLKEESLGIVIGDVSGKGVPAALFMAKAMADFRGLSHDFDEPNKALAAINDKLIDEGVSGMFVTMQYLIYKPKERKVNYSNGGHNPLVHMASEGDAKLLTQDIGSPIGIIPGSEFRDDEIKVSPGDTFVMYTDGISEARDRNQKEFGERRLLDTAFINRRLAAQELAEKLVAEVVNFSKGMPQHDDMTVIVLKIV